MSFKIHVIMMKWKEGKGREGKGRKEGKEDEYKYLWFTDYPQKTW